MSDFKDFFSRNAESYAKSTSHKSGKDLSLLIEGLRLNRSMKAIDLATGTGFTAAVLAETASSVVAYDATPEMLEQARKLMDEEKLTNVEFETGDVMQTPFEDGTFDVATCRRAAHHFTDMIKFLTEVHRILKPGGKLGIADMLRPEKDDADIFNKLERVRDNSHVGAIKVSAWRKILEDTGFQIENLTTSDELYTVERWLSPVEMDSDQGNEVRRIINELDDLVLKDGNVDRKEQTILKERIVLVARKE